MRGCACARVCLAQPHHGVVGAPVHANSCTTHGCARCMVSMPSGGGTVISVVLMLVLTVAFMAGSIYHSCTFRKRQSTPLVRARGVCWHSHDLCCPVPLPP